jgi:hypothetical protein
MKYFLQLIRWSTHFLHWLRSRERLLKWLPEHCGAMVLLVIYNVMEASDWSCVQTQPVGRPRQPSSPNMSFSSLSMPGAVQRRKWLQRSHHETIQDVTCQGRWSASKSVIFVFTVQYKTDISRLWCERTRPSLIPSFKQSSNDYLQQMRQSSGDRSRSVLYYSVGDL